MRPIRRALRGLLSPGALCLVVGLAGGLLLGYVLSRQGGWMTPAPWAIYLVALLTAIAAVSWFDERRRARPAAAADVGRAAARVAPEGVEVPTNVVEFRREPPADATGDEDRVVAAAEPSSEDGASSEDAEQIQQKEVAREC